MLRRFTKNEFLLGRIIRFKLGVHIEIPPRGDDLSSDWLESCTQKSIRQLVTPQTRRHTEMRTTESIKQARFIPTTRYLALLLFLPAILAIGCVTITAGEHEDSGMTDENPKHSFEVGSNPTIDVTSFNGEIEIITGEDGTIEVDTTLKLPSRIFYSATKSGNAVTVVARRTGSGISFGRSPQAQIHLVVPASTNVIASTSNGQLSVNGVTGTGEVDTSNGRVTLTNVTGTYVASTSNGSIKLLDVAGQFHAETSNGRIDFSGSFDENSNNKFSTSNGSMNIVFSNDPNLELDARTVNGTVDSERPILATTTEKNRLVGQYGEGSAQLELRTSNGSIDIK
ncbi:DUF4097 family beta strand repeat protein [SAR202 cluster bacterium JH702]|nr:DUF4097 family beta strand repeat protein [SAR202 cluster bacterium JH702]